MSGRYILCIDQGTSGTKAIIIDSSATVCASGHEPLQSYFPHAGYVEQSPQEIYANVIAAVGKAIQAFSETHDPREIAAIGISNQRETFMLWDSEGPVSPAIVWQCKRSVGVCKRMQKEGLEEIVHTKTGLSIDPYFSGTKLLHYRENQQLPSDKPIMFGTVDTWLLYQLTGGASYATDSTNASRTLLYNIHTQQWDEELIRLFGAEGLRLPTIKHSSDSFGETDCGKLLPHKIPIFAMIGDSHAAAVAEGCTCPGVAKATLGTGSSIMMHAGTNGFEQVQGIMNTICYDFPSVNYALEGIIVSCGATLAWMKDSLNLFDDFNELESLARSVPSSDGVSVLPAFSGMGAPYWNMEAQGAIMGMTFTTKKAHILRAALESIAFQIAKILRAMNQIVPIHTLNLDGGITRNALVMQMIADLSGIQVHTIGIPEASALGAGYLAGVRTGIFSSIEQATSCYSPVSVYIPQPLCDTLEQAFALWDARINNL